MKKHIFHFVIVFMLLSSCHDEKSNQNATQLYYTEPYISAIEKLNDSISLDSFIMAKKYYDSALIYNKELKNVILKKKAKLFSLAGPNQNLDSSIFYMEQSLKIDESKEIYEEMIILLIEKNFNSKVDIFLSKYIAKYGLTKDYYFFKILNESKKSNYSSSQKHINNYYKIYHTKEDINWLKTELINWNIDIK